MIDLEQAIDTLRKTESSLVILKEGKINIYKNKGIKDLINILKKDNEGLVGVTVADKVIGKVAAAIMVKAKIKEIYAEVISESAIKLFEKYDIKAKFRRKIPYIQNINKTGMCPMEEKFKEEESIDAIWKEYIELEDK